MSSVSWRTCLQLESPSLQQHRNLVQKLHNAVKVGVVDRNAEPAQTCIVWLAWPGLAHFTGDVNKGLKPTWIEIIGVSYLCLNKASYHSDGEQHLEAE